MEIVLCDDNPVFLKELQRQIQHIAAQRNLTFQYRCFQSPKALLEAELSEVQVIFLDIDMPEINGIEAARALRQRYREVIIVFVTGYIQYAREGYQVEAFRYLMKDGLEEELPDCLRDIQEKLYKNQACISVEQSGITIQVPLREITYFEGTAYRRVILHRTHGSLECPGKLGDYAAQLEDKGFLRIQRSYLVNMEHILWIHNYQAALEDGTRLKVSERSYGEIVRQFLLWKGQQL
jgi:DNA-binding LytR/AlgR family response regulator